MMEFTGQTETFVLPSGLSATVRELTGVDEDILTNEKLVKAGKAQHQLLGNILVDLDGSRPSSQDVLNMWSADRTAVMLRTRVLSFGASITGMHECNNADCRQEFEISVDDLLTDLTYRSAPETLESLPVDVPSGRTVTLRAMRGSDEARLLQARQKGELMTELLFSRIVSVQGIDDRTDIRNWLKNASMRDRTALRTAMEEHEFGYQTQVAVTCPACNTEQRVDVMSLTAFFFPEAPAR
jgi:hypothetical protein